MEGKSTPQKGAYKGIGVQSKNYWSSSGKQIKYTPIDALRMSPQKEDMCLSKQVYKKAAPTVKAFYSTSEDELFRQKVQELNKKLEALPTLY